MISVPCKHTSQLTHDGKKGLKMSQLPFLVWSVVLFVIQPVMEYVGHRALHIFKVKFHLKHHKDITRQNYEQYTPSVVPLAVSVTGWIVYPAWALLWVCLLKYHLVHFLIHMSDAFPKLRKHHMIHHFSNSE